MLKTDYQPGDILNASDINNITSDVNTLTNLIREEPIIKVTGNTYPSRSWASGTNGLGDLGYTYTPPDGYVVAGIVGAHMNGTAALIPVVSFYDSRIHGFVRNLNSSAITDSLYVRFLLVKAELFQ